MEKAPRARVRKQDAAGENAALKANPQHRRIKVVEDPAGVRAEEPARVKAGVKAKAGAPDRVAVGSLDILTNQLFNDN